MYWNIISIVVGAVVTALVAHLYYQKAGEELREESANLRKLSVMMLNAMEEAGLVRLNRNELGEPTGRYIERTFTETVTGTASIGTEVISAPKNVDINQDVDKSDLLNK